MAPSLILNSNGLAGSVDVSTFLDLTDDSDLDTYDPGWSSKVISHSLLREGGVLALEDRNTKELTFPLKLNASTKPAVLALVQQINQIVNTPGATYSWQDTEASQATVFDSVIGEFQVKYKYREQERHWVSGDLKLNVQPFGHVAGPRPYAAASGVGPLLMITPYASGSAQLVIGASTQAGVAGFGGIKQGGVPSSGIFYPGAPSLAGDAPALLQVSYSGPLPNTATNSGVVPYAVVSLLPDKNYQPLAGMDTFDIAPNDLTKAGAVASQYFSVGIAAGTGLTLGVAAFSPTFAASPGFMPPLSWQGVHRIFALARASVAPASIQLAPNSITPYSPRVTVPPGLDWQIYDLGVINLRPSQIPVADITVLCANGAYGLTVASAATCALDVTAFAMLPDGTSWFLNPQQITGSQYGLAPGGGAVGGGIYTSMFLLDDIAGEQYLYSGGAAGPSQTNAPSPALMPPGCDTITPFSRGLPPRPDPKNGVPIIAILGVGQNAIPSQNIVQTTWLAGVPGASWANSQQLKTSAQVTVLERARFVMP